MRVCERNYELARAVIGGSATTTKKRTGFLLNPKGFCIFAVRILSMQRAFVLCKPGKIHENDKLFGDKRTDKKIAASLAFKTNNKSDNIRSKHMYAHIFAAHIHLR